jgi:hypothetical protein
MDIARDLYIKLSLKKSILEHGLSCIHQAREELGLPPVPIPEEPASVVSNQDQSISDSVSCD